VKKLLASVLACVFVVIFVAGCSAAQTLQLQDENAALQEQIAALESQIQRMNDQQWEDLGDPALSTCGLSMIELVEDAYGNLDLVIHACRLARVTGIVAQETLSESGVYQLHLHNTLRGWGWHPGINPLFNQLYPMVDGLSHALTRAPEHLQAANLRFSLARSRIFVYRHVF